MKKVIPSRRCFKRERDKLRRWDPCWGNQVRIQTHGDLMRIVNWIKREIGKSMGQSAQVKFTGVPKFFFGPKLALWARGLGGP